MAKSTVSGALSKRIAEQQANSIESSYDEMFGLKHDDERIVSLDVSLLTPHPDDPFRHYSDAKLRELAESIEKVGLLEPVIVRPAEGGKYEILSGKNRTNAVKKNGERTIRAIVKDFDDFKAVMIITDANLKHREILAPSEKGWAYRLQVEAIKKQGERNDLGAVEFQQKLSRRIVAEINEVKDNEIQRYIRLTYLIPELLEMVDEGEIPVMAAYQVSYLDAESQNTLLCYLEETETKLTIKLAQIIRENFSKNIPLSAEKIEKFIEYNNKRESKTISFKISREKLGRFSDTVPDDETVEKLFLEFLAERFSVT